MIVNKVRSKYVELYNHKVRYLPEVTNSLIEASQDLEYEVPDLNGEKLPTTSVKTKIQTLSVDTLKIAQQIENLSPIEKQQIEIIVQTMLNSKQ